MYVYIHKYISYCHQHLRPPAPHPTVDHTFFFPRHIIHISKILVCASINMYTYTYENTYISIYLCKNRNLYTGMNISQHHNQPHPLLHYIFQSIVCSLFLPRHTYQ